LKGEVMIKLELDVNEVNVVLAGLGQLPFAQVEAVVAKIREQAIPQVQQSTQEQPEAE
jgi:hypothetical protein